MPSQHVRRRLLAGAAIAIAVTGATILYVAARAPEPQIRVVVKPNATPDEVNRVWTDVLGSAKGRRGKDNLLPELSGVTARDGEGNSAVLTATFCKSVSQHRRDSVVALIRSSPQVVRVDVVPPGQETAIRGSVGNRVELSNCGTFQVGRVALLAWIVFAWIMFAWPITLAVAILSVVLGAVGARRDMILARSRQVAISELVTSRWRLLTPSAVTGAIILWGGLFSNTAIQPPPVTPWYVHVVGVLLLIEGAVAVRLFVSRQTSGPTTLAALLPQLWIGLLAGFLAAWATTTGGTMGAL